MLSNYIVTQSTGASIDPCYAGVSAIIPCYTQEDALECVKELVRNLSESLGITLRQGECLDDDMKDCMKEGAAYSSYFYSSSGFTAWVNGQSDGWEKVETWELAEDGKYHLVEGPEL
jgi:hypothetical protein